MPDANRDSSAITSYFDGLSDLLSQLSGSQENAMREASELMANTIQRGSVVHLFGSGHSMLPVLELFPRYGSFVGLNPLTDPRLFWFNVLGTFGVSEMLFLQNTEGYADVFLEGQELKAGDAMIVFSHSGNNAVVVDAARYAQRHDIAVIAVSSGNAQQAQPRHSSGQKLSDIATVVIDTGAPRGEALLQMDGVPEPVGAVTTLLAMAAGLGLVCGTTEILQSRGHELVYSTRAESNEGSSYQNVYQAHRAAVRREGTHSTDAVALTRD
ncbi:sugar isomerase domain-containing protein [Leifsonia sp. NPDC056665]|uniref:sugar isomerase domain-containing protein n=1 Tax=Leifsonia sp. NPDC056665 TaxID=3345901 RepID=UPI00367F4C11